MEWKVVKNMAGDCELEVNRVRQLQLLDELKKKSSWKIDLEFPRTKVEWKSDRWICMWKGIGDFLHFEISGDLREDLWHK